jgi:hypothetical protein
MKTSTSDLLAEIKQIRTQYLAEVGTGGYKVWPKSIRDRVLVFADLVGSTRKAAEACEISAETIYQWRAEAKKSKFKMLPVVERSSKSVTITDPNRTNLKPLVQSEVTTPATVTVTTPEGFVFSGLDQAQVLALLFKLRAQ